MDEKNSAAQTAEKHADTAAPSPAGLGAPEAEAAVAAPAGPEQKPAEGAPQKPAVPPAAPYPQPGYPPQNFASPYVGSVPAYPPPRQAPPLPPGYGYPNYPYYHDPRFAPPQPGWNPAAYAPKPKGKWSAFKIACLTAAIVLELMIAALACFGVYALCTGNYGGRGNPSYSQNGFLQQPQLPGSNGGQNNGGNSANSTNVRMGLTCSILTQSQAASINVPGGMLIQEIDSDSSALEQNISQGDVITHIDGSAISSFEDYYRVMEGKSPGDTVEVTVVKVKDTKNSQGVWETETIRATLTLLERDASTNSPRYPET